MRDRERVAARAGDGRRGDRRAARLRARGGGGRERRRRPARTPATCSRASRPRGAAHDPAVRAPRHRAAGGAGRGGARGRRLPQPQRGASSAPTTRRPWRCCWRWRGGWPADGSPVGVELLFTTAEELALRGAKEFDRRSLRSEFGFVFDHASPIGELIVAAPTYFRLEARFHGAAAHAGHPPRGRAQRDRGGGAGRSRSMRLGRLDEQTTANVGTIEGGTAANVVAERCGWSWRRAASTTRPRGRRDRRDGRTPAPRPPATPSATWRPWSSSCSAATGCRARRRRSRPRPRRSSRLGIEPDYVATGGGSDANALIAAGLPVLNVANGTERNHQPDESVTAEALETDARRDPGDRARRVGASEWLRAHRHRGDLAGPHRRRAGGHLPLRRRRGGHARDRQPPRRGHRAALRRRADLARAPAARAGRRAGAARAPGGQARPRGRGAGATSRSASWPRRSARARATGGTS